jgi:glycosyltransferase involved in cell wall biosynthesis
MNILYIIHQFYPNHYSGTERVVFETASYMQKLGHKVTILTYSHEDNYTYQNTQDEIMYKEFMYQGLNVIAVKSDSTAYNSSYFIDSSSPIYEFLIDKINPQVVHVAHLMYMYSFLKAVKRLNIPYIISLTDFWLICHRAQMITSAGDLCSGPKEGKQCKKICLGLEKEYYEKRFELAHEILSESKANIVSSQFLRNTMKHFMLDFHSKYVPYGLNFSYLETNNIVYDKNSKIHFLFSGTLSKHKGIDIVIEVFQSLKKDNFELNIYGHGPLQDFVSDKAKHINSIHYHGSYSKEDTKNLIKSNDVVLVPSAWYENNPIILQEMIAANIPPIVSNVGSLPEMVEDKKTGFVFEMSNTASLKRVVKDIIANPASLNAIKSNMYNNYKVITIEQQVLSYIDIYERTIKDSD